MKAKMSKTDLSISVKFDSSEWLTILYDPENRDRFIDDFIELLKRVSRAN